MDNKENLKEELFNIVKKMQRKVIDSIEIDEDGYFSSSVSEAEMTLEAGRRNIQWRINLEACLEEINE